MPLTYSLIASSILTSTASSVTFSSIPASYTDLLIRSSSRSTSNGIKQNDIQIKFNASTSNTTHSYTNLRNNNGNAVTSVRASNILNQYPAGSGSSATADTFSPMEIYIPNYNTIDEIPTYSSGFAEDYSTTVEAVGVTAGLWRGAQAITSIELITDSSTFASGSRFFLYGIKKN